MNGACHCGAVRLELPRLPSHINACNCSLCFKLGAAWGYYRVHEVSIVGETRGYIRADRAQPSLSAHACLVCGAVTHWVPLSPTRDKMAVNMRLFDPEALADVEVRFTNGRDGDGSASAGYVRPHMRFSDCLA